MSVKLTTKYNPYAREALDDLFLLDEEFDYMDNPLSTISRMSYMN